MAKEQSEFEKDPRPAALGTISGISVAMLALCIPLCAIMGSVAGKYVFLLPLAIIGGMTFLSLLIWFFPMRRRNAGQLAQLQQQLEELRKQNEELQGRIRDLHERVGNIEIMDSYERKLAQRQMAASDAQHPSSQAMTTVEDSGQMMRPGMQGQERGG